MFPLLQAASTYKTTDRHSTMAEADLCTGLLNVVTHFVEQHGRPSAPTEEELELFTRMLRHYNGKMHVRQLCLDFDRPLDWMRDHSSRFHVFEDDNGKAVMVGVVARGVRICPNYNISYRTPECRDTHCKGFHVCRDHVGGWCRAGAGCRRSHSFTDSHNRHLTEWFRLDGFSPDELFMILALSTPQVCSDYNNKGCALMSTCTRVHVCRNYVAGTCKNANCDRAHDYQSAHSQRLLGMYRLNALDVDCVRRHLLFYRVIPHRMPVQGRAAGLHALAAVLGCRKEEQRFVDTTAQLLGGDSGDESPPPSVTEDRHNEESIHAKTDLPTPSVRSATSANAVAGLSEKCAFRNRVRKLHSTRVKRYSTKEQQEREKTSAAEVHIHPIAAESINVCEDNIQGTCLFANRCACHHYPQPFVWQVNAFDKWVTLDEVNDVIESSFCDPGKDDVLVKVRRFVVSLIVRKQACEIMWSDPESCELLQMLYTKITIYNCD